MSPNNPLFIPLGNLAILVLFGLAFAAVDWFIDYAKIEGLTVWEVIVGVVACVTFALAFGLISVADALNLAQVFFGVGLPLTVGYIVRVEYKRHQDREAAKRVNNYANLPDDRGQ